MLNRRRGHTTAAVNGVKSAPNGVLVCFNQQHARIVKTEHGVKTLSLDQIEMLRGSTQQVVFDHFVVEHLLETKRRLETQLLRESETRMRYEMQLVTVCLGFQDLETKLSQQQAMIQVLESELSKFRTPKSQKPKRRPKKPTVAPY